MSAWNFMDYSSKANLLDAVERESAGMLALAADPSSWTGPTGAGDWEVRDVIGHLLDTTETYFVGFDAARGNGDPPPSVPLREMAVHADRGARQFRDLAPGEALERLSSDLTRMLAIEEALLEGDWGQMVPHKYMGPLPAFFYPAFQLVDYAVHSWDIREGTGSPHGLDARSADLLVPLCFVLWTATAVIAPKDPPLEVGVRIVSGENAGETRIGVGPDGLVCASGPVADLPVIIDFDPGSFVLTAYGRTNAGTIHGDRDLADRFLSGFFRI